MKKYIKYCLTCMILILAACTAEKEITEIVPGDTRVNLLGILPMADESPRTNIYVKAFAPGPPNVYLNETLATIPQGLSETTPHNIVFPGANPYYPLGGTNEINIFAYSGKAPGDFMQLRAGTSINNDAVLSNYGKRRNDPAVDPSYAPTGTPGSSENPAQILQFRHVMTQLIVDYEIDESEQPPVDPVPTRISFTMNDIVGTGRYAIRATETETAVNPAGSYAVQLGTNYLVSTGEDLYGKPLTSLRIDDYIATPADLAGFTIQGAAGETEMLLMPGYSYRLTFFISRLRVRGIRVAKINWVATERTGNTTYDPYTLNLSLGDYNNTGEDAINRVVLTTSEGRTYIGQTREGETGVKFVTLPTSGVNQVSLYTQRGLLINSPVTTGYDYGTNTLTLPVSVGGMVPVNPAQPYSPTNPYAITTPAQFMNVERMLDGHYRQMVTVDLRTLNLIESERFFNGFGAFTGSYDGNGYRIDGIDIQGAGLFESNSGILEHIRISTGTIDASGLTVAGTICGTNSGTIVGCINEARIINTEGTTSPQGGICGINTDSGSIVACINTGTILQGSIVGGICGRNENTSEGAIRACINTGALNPAATALGFICGSSVDSPNNVIRTSFGLVGTAQHVIGGPEYPIGQGAAGDFDSSSLEPPILRNGLETPGMPETARVVNRLNGELSLIPWGSQYQYIYNNAVTSITWPAPVSN